MYRELLQILDLSHNKLDETNIIKIFEFCKGCSSLSELYLNSACMNEDQFKETIYMELCEFLIHCSTINILGMNFTQILDTNKGLLKNIETALIHNLSLIKWETDEFCKGKAIEYKKFLDANLFIQNHNDLKGIENLPENIRNIVNTKNALLNQYNSGDMPKKPEKMEIIREATYEDDEESKGNSKIIVSPEKRSITNEIQIIPDEKPATILKLEKTENNHIEIMKSFEENLVKRDEEIDQKLLKIQEELQKIKKIEKLTYETNESKKEISILKAENEDLKNQLKMTLTRIENLEKKSFSKDEMIENLTEIIDSEINNNLDQKISENIQKNQNDINAHLSELQKYMTTTQEDLVTTFTCKMQDFDNKIGNIEQKILEFQDNKNMQNQLEQISKKLEENSTRNIKKSKEELDKKFSEENANLQSKLGQLEKKLENVIRSQDLLRKQSLQSLNKTEKLIKEFNDSHTEKISINSQTSYQLNSETLKNLPEFTAVKQKAQNAIVFSMQS